ncbi:hypothetical protein ACJX0J_008798 [Zea mays]
MGPIALREYLGIHIDLTMLARSIILVFHHYYLLSAFLDAVIITYINIFAYTETYHFISDLGIDINMYVPNTSINTNSSTEFALQDVVPNVLFYHLHATWAVNESKYHIIFSTII